jgi:hypothetical protein
MDLGGRSIIRPLLGIVVTGSNDGCRGREFIRWRGNIVNDDRAVRVGGDSGEVGTLKALLGATSAPALPPS